jgi:hypothetical protein
MLKIVINCELKKGGFKGVKGCGEFVFPQIETYG